MNPANKYQPITLPEEEKRAIVLSSVLITANNFFQAIVPDNNFFPDPITKTIKMTLQTSTDILLAAYSSQVIEKRLKDLIDQLNINFKFLQKDINSLKKMDTPAFEKIFRETIKTSSQKKIKVFANVLTHILINRSKNNENLALLNDVSGLEIDHILFLSYVKKSLDKKPIEKKSQFPKITKIGSLLGFDHAYSHKIASDLLKLGILTDPMIGTFNYSGFQQTEISNYGLKFIESVKGYENKK